MSPVICLSPAVDQEMPLAHYAAVEQRAATGVAFPKDPYATIPLPITTSRSALFDEEELYTSFEQALSGRLAELNWRLSRLESIPPSPHNTDSLVLTHSALRDALFQVQQQARKRRIFPLLRCWQQIVIFTSLAVMFTLLGFDLLGLLILVQR